MSDSNYTLRHQHRVDAACGAHAPAKLVRLATIHKATKVPGLVVNAQTYLYKLQLKLGREDSESALLVACGGTGLTLLPPSLSTTTFPCMDDDVSKLWPDHHYKVRRRC
jgi:hypothetical protein